MNLSIRARSTFYFSSLVGLFLVSFVLVLTATVSASLRRDLRARVDRDADVLGELFKEEMRLKALDEFQEEATELGLTLRILDDKGAVFFQSRMWNQRALNIEAPRLEPGAPHQWSSMTLDGVPHMILSQSLQIPGYPPFVLQLAEPMDAMRTARRKMLQWSAILIPMMIALSVFAGAFFGKRALAPIETLRRRADALRLDDLSARVPYPPNKDELYYLTDTLNRTLGRIEEGYARMKTFTADAAHELRIPLTAMRGAVEVALRQERTPEQYRAALSDALEEAERLSHITADLLALARADAGELTVHRSPVPVRVFLERVVAGMNAVGNGSRGPVVFDGAPEETVAVDADQMERALQNLIDNALKHGSPGAAVHVAAEISGGALRFLVRDSGPGIPPEHQGRIFDRFYRVDKTRARALGGSGLGLSIVLSIARSHGGIARLKSSSSSGSVFEIELPLGTSNPALKPL